MKLTIIKTIKSNREVIKEALERIKLEYLQTNLNTNNTKVNWVGLDGKINILSKIAKELLEINDKNLKEIEDVTTIITNKNEKKMEPIFNINERVIHIEIPGIYLITDIIQENERFFYRLRTIEENIMLDGLFAENTLELE